MRARNPPAALNEPPAARVNELNAQLIDATLTHTTDDRHFLRVLGNEENIVRKRRTYWNPARGPAFP